MPPIRRREGHDGENYGPHEVEHAVSVARFPISRTELLEHYGAKTVQIEPGHAVDLKSILERLPEETFESAEDVREAARRAWDDIASIRPYSGYPGEEAWSDKSPAPEAQEHIEEYRQGLSGDQHRLG